METTKIYSSAYTAGNAKNRLKRLVQVVEPNSDLEDLQAGKGSIMQLTDQG